MVLLIRIVDLLDSNVMTKIIKGGEKNLLQVPCTTAIKDIRSDTVQRLFS